MCCAVLPCGFLVLSAEKNKLSAFSVELGPLTRVHVGEGERRVGAEGEEAASGSALGGKRVIFCYCLFALAFVFPCYSFGPVIFLILSNRDFSNYAHLVHRCGAAAVRGLCCASCFVFAVRCIYACA